MREHEKTYSIRTLSRCLRVSPSGYYRWRLAGPGKRELNRLMLESAIREIHEASRCRYGSPRVHAYLRRKGHRCGVDHVANIMRKAGIRGKARRRYKATTNSKHAEPASPNLVPQGMRAIRPDQIWVSDVTYIRTEEGWLYLCVFLDLFSRKVVGWSVSGFNDVELVMSAFWAALKERHPNPGFIVHSDRGGPFAAKKYRAMLQSVGAVQSMSRKGNCYDNAVCESFFHSLKVELDAHRVYEGRADARSDLFEFIEAFYNRERIHSALGFQSPEQFELLARSA